MEEKKLFQEHVLARDRLRIEMERKLKERDTALSMLKEYDNVCNREKSVSNGTNGTELGTI